MTGHLTEICPEHMTDKILWTYILTSLDFSNKHANMVQGSIKQGAYLPLQMGYLRPNEECSQYRPPVEGLYICGASCHPGGFVFFDPGYNTATTIVENMGIEKWWPEPEIVAARRKGYFGDG